MGIMTDEEAFALDEYYTQNPPKVDPSKARIRIPLVRLDNASAEYLAKEAKATHKKPEEIINEMIQERITASRGEPSPLSWLG
jgi:hypothetical protein